MAASENKAICEQSSRQIAQPVLQNTTVTKIYQGTLVDIDATGALIPAVAGATGVFGGVAVEYAEVPAGSAKAVSDVKVMVRKTGTWQLKAQALTAADLGKEVEIVDNETVKVYDAGHKCGVIREVISATEALVAIDGYAK